MIHQVIRGLQLAHTRGSSGYDRTKKNTGFVLQLAFISNCYGSIRSGLMQRICRCVSFIRRVMLLYIGLEIHHVFPSLASMIDHFELRT